jgi:hypothetical protein
MAKQKNIVTKTYLAVCCKDPSHEFPVVVDVIEGTDEVVSSLEVYCPDCGAMNKIRIKGDLKPDAVVTRYFDLEKHKT